MTVRPLYVALASLVAGALAPTAHARPFTATDLVDLARVSDPQLSPDGSHVLYQVRTTNRAANKGVTSLWIGDLQGHAARQQGSDGASSGRWGATGTIVYLLRGQVWSAGACSAECRAPSARQLTHLPLDVQAFQLSRDGRRLVVALAVFPDADDPVATKARLDARANRPAGGQIFDKLFVRHWDTWSDGTKNHLFALALDPQGEVGGPAIPLTPGLDGDVPGKPFGGDEDFVLSPDGASVYFSARIAGRSEPWSTNFDLYRAPTDGSAAPVDLTADNKAWDAGPVVSPDGRTLAYRAMKRPGFEADRFSIWLMDIATGAKRELTGGWDRSPEALQWSVDGRTLLATAEDEGGGRLFAVDATTGRVAPLTNGAAHVGGFTVAAGAGSHGEVVYTHESFTHPATLRLMSLAAGSAPARPLGVDPNAEAMARLETTPGEPFNFSGWNGDTVKGWVFKPAGYHAGAKYPVAFLIHGGPQGSWGSGWSYRWNPQVFTGAGYAVVLIDFHGSTGYGQPFTDSISGHWGDRPLEDLQKGWAAALENNAFLDGSRACALGASYGGFMVNWIAGVWNAPWKCLVTHDGVFDDRSMGYATEELWFSEWEHDHHTPWQDPAAYERFNPVDHVAAWTKPQLIIHGGRDYRIPLEQGLGAFTALQRKGVESRFLYFPDENHWVLKPADSMQWNATVFAWLDAHLKS